MPLKLIVDAIVDVPSGALRTKNMIVYGLLGFLVVGAARTRSPASTDAAMEAVVSNWKPLGGSMMMVVPPVHSPAADSEMEGSTDVATKLPATTSSAVMDSAPAVTVPAVASVGPQQSSEASMRSA